MKRFFCAFLFAFSLYSCGSDTNKGKEDSGPLFPEDGWGWEQRQQPDGQSPDGKDDVADDIQNPNDAVLDGFDLPDIQLDEGPQVAGWHIKIISPTNNDTVGKTVLVRIEPVEKQELKVDSLVVSLGGTEIFRDTKLPTEFVLDTAAHANGSLALEAKASLGDEFAIDAVTVSATNPDFNIRRVSADRTQVYDGAVVNLQVEADKAGLSVSANFAILDSTFQTTAGMMQDAGNGLYTLQYKISNSNTMPDGNYIVPVTATDGTSTQVSQHLQFYLVNTNQIPVRVEGAIFVPGFMPGPTTTWSQPISLVYGNDFIITGGSAKLNVDFSGYAVPDEIVGILIGVEGMTGYYQKPLDTTLGEEEVLMLMRSYSETETPPSKLNVQIAVKDIRGRVSTARTHTLSVQAVGSGDVQVSISWDTATDVDLHVIEPTSCELYYGNKNCTSGGWLDLDSNPACTIDNINNENVFWPAGQAPVGDYKVRVDFYDDCGTFGVGKPANYTVTIHYCGITNLVDGSFAAGSDDSGGQGSGVEVATFNNEICGKLLHGRIRFQDHTIDRYGTGAWQWKPVRFATVEVVRAWDDTVLATTYTDRLGDYEVFFSNPSQPGIYLRVKAQTRYTDNLRKINIMNHPKFKKTYAVKTPTVDETQAVEPEISYDIGEADAAGAFNILDVVSDGYDTIRLMTGTDLGELTVFWATGADTTDTLFCSQFFYDQGTCTELNALSVQGKDTDRDEYDDMVILKEFFKFALARCSKDDNPGGYHDGTRDDPRRSWSEGVSTFFPCDVLGQQWFVNSRPAGVYLVWDLETINSPFAYKAIPGVIDGDVSEYLISSLLWDLADSGNGESFDPIQGKRLPIYDSVFNYLPGSAFLDRGVEGVDLVDFLDGWFCRAWGENINMMQLVTEHYLFGYDLGGPSDCFAGQ